MTGLACGSFEFDSEEIYFYESFEKSKFIYYTVVPIFPVRQVPLAVPRKGRKYIDKWSGYACRKRSTGGNFISLRINKELLNFHKANWRGLGIIFEFVSSRLFFFGQRSRKTTFFFEEAMP